MSKQNKIVREELERIYGHICMMHQGLKINGYSKSKISYSGKAIARQLTLHHIKPRRLGGKTTIENGAVLCRGCHDYLELTTPENREKLNQMLVAYKAVRVEEVDDLDTGMALNLAELEIDKKGCLKLKRLRQEAKKEEKRELQRLKKEWEDR